MKRQYCYLYLLPVILLFYSCSSSVEKNTIVTVCLDTISEKNVLDSSSREEMTFYNSIGHSLNASHINFICRNGESKTIVLNQTLDSLYIYDIDSLDYYVTPLPFKRHIPIASFYFHNYDSIFVFIEREIVYKLNKQGANLPDFILINQDGVLKDKYYLDSVPYIFKGELNPMIFLTAGFVSNSRLINNKIYLPYSIYLPTMSNLVLKQLDIRLICEYDLNERSVRMLNVRIPDCDIGKQFSKGVSISNIDYYIFNDTIIFLSYLYSSDIYKYNIARDKEELVARFPKIVFNNKINDTSDYAVTFKAPIYCKRERLYLRSFYVRIYKDYKNFSGVQVLDTNLNIIAYDFGDSLYFPLKMNYEGRLVKTNRNTFVNHYVSINENFSHLTISEVEDKYLRKKPKVIRKKSFMIDKEKVPYRDRLDLYLNLLEISYGTKLILINTNMMCSDCMNFLFAEMNKSKSDSSVAIKFLFYGDDLNYALDIINKYKLKGGASFIFDEKQIYREVFMESEMHRNSFVYYKQNKMELIEYEPSTIVKKYKEFVDLK
jgi:hypothetical protein